MGAMRRFGPPITLLAALAGCGAAGPEIRLMPDPAEWRPAKVVVLVPTVAGGGVSTRALPGGPPAPTATEAIADVRAALVAVLAGCAAAPGVEPAGEFTRSETAGAVEKVARQYQDARQIDPALGVLAGAEWGGPEPAGSAGVLVVTVLKYGAEVDEDVSSMSKSVSTTVGTTDVGISSSAQRIVAYLNVHVRCALIRGHDGALIWDASARRRVKSANAGEGGLPGLLAQAMADLCLGWPWRPRPVEAAQEPGAVADGADVPKAPVPAAAPVAPAVPAPTPESARPAP